MRVRKSPFDELEELIERMNREFAAASEGWERPESLGRWYGGGEELAMDLVDRDGEFVATVDLPGFDREDVEIEVTEHRLRIEAERETAHDEAAEHFLRHERQHEATTRSVRLPESVDVEGVTAKMNNGVLTVTLPKLEAEETHSVDIDVE